jgi:flagellar hook-length control protein FliK
VQLQQIDPARAQTPAPRRRYVSARLIENLPVVSDRTLAARSDAEQRAERRRQHADSAAQRQAHQSALAETTPAQAAIQSERRLDPSSRAAARRDFRAALRDRSQPDGRSFQDALADVGAQRAAPDAPAATTSEPTHAPATVHGDGPNAALQAADPPTQASALGNTAVAPAAEAPTPLAARASAASPPSPPPSAGAPAVSPITAASGASPVATNSITPIARSATPTADPGAAAGAPASARPAPAATPHHRAAESASPSSNADARAAPRAPTSASDTAPAEHAADSADRISNIERIVRIVRRQLDREKSSAIVRLDPPELGLLRLRLDLAKNALSLDVRTHTHLAHRLLSEQLDRLRDGLAAAGIQLERVDIHPPPREALDQPGAWRQDDPSQPDRHDRPHAGSDGAGRDAARTLHDAGGPETAALDRPGATLERIGPAAESRVNVWA